MGNQVARLTGWLRALSVAIVLTGQALVSAHAGIYAGPAQNAAAWLESQQAKSDGSWRDASESRTFLQTAEAVLALHQANRRNAAYYAGQAWIENHDPQNLDARARRLRSFGPRSPAHNKTSMRY